MITLNFSVDDQLLTRTDENTVAANSHLVHTCEFVFSSEWDGRGKVATFKKRDLMLSVILDDDACTIPPEILQSENKIDVFELSVCGADGNSTITSTVVKVPILAGTWDVMSTEITPTMFEQIMQKIDEVEKGEVSPELIYEAVSDYMEAHPLEPIVADDVAAYFAAHVEELKGPKGDTGATPNIAATAEVGATVGAPSVSVTKTGTAENPALHFNFQNLKGAKGDTGTTPTISAAATVDNTTGTPAVNVSKTGTDAAPEFTFAFSGLKGPKGDPGEPGDQSVWEVQGTLGAKNLLDPDYYDGDSKINHSVTYTKNADGSITCNGTADNYSKYYIKRNATTWLKAGIYTLSCDELAGLTGSSVQIGTGDFSQLASISPSKTSVDFIVAQDGMALTLRIWIDPGNTVNNATLRPMIRYAVDTDNTYHPYAKTNKELTNEVNDLKANAYLQPYEGITCWGDSLTTDSAYSWSTRLGELSGLTIFNAGTGGEDAQTIMARQGGDVMQVNNITIPATTAPVTIGAQSNGGIDTELGRKANPKIGTGATHANPVMIANIEGTMRLTNTGEWTFTRKTAGEQVVIDRPTAIRTNFDRNHNSYNEIIIIFMGSNGWGSNDVDELVNMHKLMIEHFKGKEYVVLGFSKGSTVENADYEAAMAEAFGRRFISLRQYLAHPIYENGEIVSCYGLADQGLEPGTKTYNGVTYVALDEIAQGIVPHQILEDTIHFTRDTKIVIGNMLYKKMQELNILA